MFGTTEEDVDAKPMSLDTFKVAVRKYLFVKYMTKAVFYGILPLPTSKPTW